MTDDDAALLAARASLNDELAETIASALQAGLTTDQIRTDFEAIIGLHAAEWSVSAPEFGPDWADEIARRAVRVVLEWRGDDLSADAVSDLADLLPPELLRHWHVGHNMPGCLPSTSEPAATFGTWHEAREALDEELGLAWDQAADEEAQGDFLAAHTRLHGWREDEDIQLGADGEVWWLRSCDGSNCQAAPATEASPL